MNVLNKEARRKRAAQEAADWAVRLEVSTLSAADRAEFADWLRESPLHVSEMLRVSSIEGLLRNYPGWRHLESNRSFSVADVVELPTRYRPSPNRSRFWQSWWKPAAVACAILMLAVSATILFRSHGETYDLRTRAGERREITLGDGSRVSAEPNTELRIELSAKQRSIAMTHGDATFHVAKDRSRPFVVIAMHAQITAVGTIFRVANASDQVLVQVAEGKVAVERLAEGSPFGEPGRLPAIALVAHQQLVISAAGTLTPVPSEPAPVASLGSRIQLVFDDEPLNKVVERFNHANGLQIRVSDESLAQTRVSGVFDQSDPESFVAFLEVTGHAHAVHVTPNEVMLQPKNK